MSEKRINMTNAEKKRYAEILVKTPKKSDGKKTINELFRKKHGQDIPPRTFTRLYNDRFKHLDSKSKCKFKQDRKKSSSMEKFEKKIIEEYQKRQIKIKTRGVTNFIKKVKNDHFADDPDIMQLQISTRFVLRVIRDRGKITSKKTDRIFLTEEERNFELQRLRACRSNYPLRLVTIKIY